MSAITPAAIRDFAACQRLLFERATWLAENTGSVAAQHAAQRMREAAEHLDELADELEPLQ